MSAVRTIEPKSGRHGAAHLVARRRAEEARRLLKTTPRQPVVRMDKVRCMRSLIARGKLVTPERIEGTVQRLMKELGL